MPRNDPQGLSHCTLAELFLSVVTYSYHYSLMFALFPLIDVTEALKMLRDDPQGLSFYRQPKAIGLSAAGRGER